MLSPAGLAGGFYRGRFEMSGLTNVLNISKNSLFTNQKTIEITGNNIANVNTPGYSRQEATLTPSPTLNFKGFFIGNGVTVTGVEREHDVFLARQLMTRNATFGEESGKAGVLQELERVFSFDENGLSGSVDQFFGAWHELAANPSGQIERSMVIQRGNILANAFQTASTDLDYVYQNINSSLYSKVDDVNIKLQKVAGLNDDIASIELSGQSANSLRDQRDQLLDELSFSLGIKSYEEPSGMVSIQLPDGISLVSGNKAITLEKVMAGNDLDVQVKVGAIDVKLTADRLGGELKGLVGLRDNFADPLRDDFDTLAYSLVSEVNAQHEAGMGLDGVTGRSFFTPLAAAADASRAIAVQIQDVNEIAAGTSDALGDNTNAQLIANLGDKKAVNGEASFVGFYGDIAARIGVAANQNELSRGGSEDALTQLQNLRDGTVGVSLEEEMVNLIKYQRGYEAAAKLMSTVDSLLGNLIEVMR